MKTKSYHLFMLSACMCLPFAACTDDGVDPAPPSESMGDIEYVGKAVGNFSADEWYPGGASALPTTLPQAVTRTRLRLLPTSG